MHLVFLTSLVTSGAPESGYEIANYALIGGLRRAGHNVTEIGYKWSGSTQTNPDQTICLGEVDVKTDTASLTQKLQWLGKAVATGTPFACAKLKIVSEAELASAIDNAAAINGPVDGVVLNGVTLAGAYEKLLTKNPYLYIAHNVEHVSAAQSADDAAGLVEKLMYRREAIYLKRLERRLCAKADHVLTLTEEDRHGLSVASDDRSISVPLVTPKPTANKPTQNLAVGFDVGMIGTWTWTPNRIGLEWFLRDVAPLLPEDISIAVAGKTPKDLASRAKNVMFLGRVMDAKAFSQQNRVMALTSTAGTGVQLKTIEALEMGLSCVATPLSMRGIATTPSNVTVAKNANDFANALVQHVAAHRAGKLAKVDGQAFRASQIAAMDTALAKAIDRLTVQK